MNSDGPLLSKLFFCFVNLANEIDETFAGFGNTLLGPIGKLQKKDKFLKFVVIM